MVTLERNTGSRRHIRKHAALFALGATMSGAAMSVPAGLIGHVLQAWLSAGARAMVFVGASLLLALIDLRVLGIRPPSLRRQTEPRLYKDLGPRWTWFLWGLDLGLGWTTIRATSLYWVFLLWGILLVEPLAVSVGFAAYGLALSLSVFGSQIGTKTAVRACDCRSTRFLQFAPSIARYAGLATASLAGIVLLGQIAGT